MSTKNLGICEQKLTKQYDFVNAYNKVTFKRYLLKNLFCGKIDYNILKNF